MAQPSAIISIELNLENAATVINDAMTSLAKEREENKRSINPENAKYWKDLREAARLLKQKTNDLENHINRAINYEP